MANDTIDEEAERNCSLQHYHTHTGDTHAHSLNLYSGPHQSNFDEAGFAVLKDCAAVKTQCWPEIEIPPGLSLCFQHPALPPSISLLSTSPSFSVCPRYGSQLLSSPLYGCISM